MRVDDIFLLEKSKNGRTYCPHCDKEYDYVLQIGESRLYDDPVQWICKDCLKKALKLFPKEKA